jgi:hypothetical protein
MVHIKSLFIQDLASRMIIHAHYDFIFMSFTSVNYKVERNNNNSFKSCKSYHRSNICALFLSCLWRIIHTSYSIFTCFLQSLPDCLDLSGIYMRALARANCISPIPSQWTVNFFLFFMQLPSSLRSCSLQKRDTA